ncbi:hypothetical protein [Pseudomonas sp. BC42]|uniref:hypothetical protein n=1 Tax=Pseudomonas sp. BC42 TaxID=2933816 RepID=UPI001F1B85F2|nr:hypothetical protein [Pseudomonas sp. BC42]ULT73036.1 hypothetical protein L1O02_11920 [Pseudomonas sp. BC42]
MIKINLSPILMGGRLEVSVRGFELTVCCEVFDFTPLKKGYELSAADIGSELFAGPAVMSGDGDLEVTLLLPYSDPDAPMCVRFPEPIFVTADGPVEIPKEIPAEQTIER